MLPTFALTVFPFLVIVAAFSDLLTMTIPNRLSAALAIAFAVCAVLAGFSAEQILLHIASGAVVLMLGFGAFAAGWMGGGDVKLAASAALWLGFGHLPDFTLLSAVLGGALTLAILGLRQVPLPAFALGWAWLNRLHDRRSGVPYGVALAGAALLAYPQSSVWSAAFPAF
jgi:prepilin peptidase CpaA